MASAFVLINTEIGSEEAVLDKIKVLSNVKTAQVVYGIYDIVCKLEAEDMAQLKEYIQTNIRKIDLVRSTLTLIET